jgi:hypothetical protein
MSGILRVLTVNIVLSLFNTSPFEKGGRQGDLNFFTASGDEKGI